MSDLFSGLTRSQLMSRIRSRGNKRTELAMVQLLRKHKITGWRRHPALLGTPDFAFAKQGVVLFVDGCFWHGCPKHSRHVSKSGESWVTKIQNNQRRDRRVSRALKTAGWRVVRVWEHDLARKHEERLVRRLKKNLANSPTARRSSIL